MSKQSYPFMLVVEDSDEDFAALNRIIERTSTVQVPAMRCTDGDDALDFLYQRGAYADRASNLPALILLDLNLPGTDGREVLTQIKQDERLREIPVVILTTSSNPKDIQACYQSGVNSYLLKPTDIEQFKVSIRLFMDYWFTRVVLPSSCQPI